MIERAPSCSFSRRTINQNGGGSVDKADPSRLPPQLIEDISNRVRDALTIWYNRDHELRADVYVDGRRDTIVIRINSALDIEEKLGTEDGWAGLGFRSRPRP